MTALLFENYGDEKLPGELLGRGNERARIFCPCGRCYGSLPDCDPSLSDADALLSWLLDAGECRRRPATPPLPASGREGE